MPVPMLLQRLLVAGHLKVRDVRTIHGIPVALHPSLDLESQVISVDAALAALMAASGSYHGTVKANVSAIIVTESLRNVLAPHGACFLSLPSPEWKSSREFAGWLTWCAVYIQASREFRLTRRSAAIAAERASASRADFYRAYDLVTGHAPDSAPA